MVVDQSSGTAPESLDFCEADRFSIVPPGFDHGADWHFPTFSDFDVGALVASGVRNALIDLDGTLTPAYHHDKMTPETVVVLHALMGEMETVSIASNNEWDLSHLLGRFSFRHLFQPYQESTMLPYKPSVEFYEHILSTLGVPPETVVMIGDNPFDDVLGAAELGMRTVLVDRLDPYDFFAGEL